MATVSHEAYLTEESEIADVSRLHESAIVDWFYHTRRPGGDEHFWELGTTMCRELNLIRSQGRLRDDGIQFQIMIVDVPYVCTHKHAISVARFRFSGTPIRLVNGTSSQSGRVEVEYRGRWGTICDDGFDDLEAKKRKFVYQMDPPDNKTAAVVCRMLGFEGGGYLIGEVQPRSKIVIRNLDCSNTEGDISDCKSDTWGVDYPCDQASIVCGKKLIVIELTVLWETRCEEAYERKEAKYTELLDLCKQRGWRTWLRYLFPVSVQTDDSNWRYWQR
ncbi:hypothetical protein DPMN_024434 [Dreissena polymorpha]|uniref:SRCR domain-containing protein n=1 Tax=Dreissena polymorpha TaxID=45954 RepID=A0A9D4LPJ4_DREPO|nr:hypothetical protein DPMN_024434 [Dreissena polymorpha]